MKAHANFNRLKIKFALCFALVFVAVSIGKMGRRSMVEPAVITQNAQQR